ncbi:putative tyrosine decarboxylase [Xylona heveae TC161]|uniref:Putative tyrosine decarboxylase n=1 Tax=Xylona heveae (strain CBS 132557 / TC161) TaxID=1328760 RepID=A0A165I490_XYLHT|nr:putative tyrosine decarboxylase [Xylona heveae TC161]KZF24360.1 putative tyrosine decarboxylase [Xylona heveae TC161]
MEDISGELYTDLLRHGAHTRHEIHGRRVLPDGDLMKQAIATLPTALRDDGLGVESTSKYILQELVPALSANSQSPNYYGFVTGGVTPAALIADHIVTDFDQNVQVHLPKETIATVVEDTALRLLLQLFHLDEKTWVGRTFTTGATASNVLGLACGRDFVVSHVLKGSEISVAEHGFIEVASRLNRRIQILTTTPHSSLSKAASIVGLGRLAVKNISVEGSVEFDMSKLETCIADPEYITIVAISCGEVNTGHFATNGLQNMQYIRALCDRYGAWIHVDGAFGLFGRILDSVEFEHVMRGCEGLELADSITGDGHKLLNVPYDCGFFFTRHLSLAESVFRNPNAAYLSSNTGPKSPDDPFSSSIPSPLNIGIENSRRFRALPVLATLLAYGRIGYKDMLQRQIRLAREIAGWIHDSEDYELLPDQGVPVSETELLSKIYIIVLFRAKDPELNRILVQKIKDTSKMYVSGTSWGGSPATRIAISTWRVDVQRDFELVRNVLADVSRTQS